MSYIFSRALVEAFLEANCSDSEPSAPKTETFPKGRVEPLPTRGSTGPKDTAETAPLNGYEPPTDVF